MFPKLPNGKLEEPNPIDTVEISDSPLREMDTKPDLPDKRLRTPSPRKDREKYEILDNETGEIKEELNITSKPAEELNREFLESLPKPKEEEKPVKISVKPVEKLIEPSLKDGAKVFDGTLHNTLLNELTKHNLKDSSKVIDEKKDSNSIFLNELANKLHLGKLYIL